MAPDLPEARFCPYCGEALEHPPEPLAPFCEACRYVHLDAPTPVAAALIERDGKVLLARPHDSDVFALVAGYPEPFESIEAAAVREAKEETGLDIRIERMLGTWSCEPMGRNLVLVVCVARVTGGSFSLQAEELAEAAWFSLDQLPDWPTTSPLHEVFTHYKLG